MKKIILNIILIMGIASISNVSLFSQFKVDTTGRVRNFGKITVKDKIFESTGNINNQGGQIYVNGSNAFIKQDTLDGFIEFERPSVTAVQIVPLITYDSISMKGEAAKVFGTKDRNLVSKSYFNSSANNISWNKADNIEIHTNGYTRLDGTINEGASYGRVKMNGTNLQPVTGTGRYKELELDNSAGAQVVEGGGFVVGTKLILTKGRLKNDVDNNFIMASKSVLERTADGFIDLGPFWDSPGNIVYTDNGSGKEIRTGPELLIRRTSDNVAMNLDTLRVENAKGIKLDENVTVDGNLTLLGDIRTYDFAVNNGEFTFTNEKELVYTPEENPNFVASFAEINGKFTRTNLPIGKDIIFNNKFTFSRFANEVNKRSIVSLTMDIRKGVKFDNSPYVGGDKVFRTMNLSANDINDNNVDSLDMFFQYAWRNQLYSAGDMPSTLFGRVNDADLGLIIWSEKDQLWDNILTTNQRKANNAGEEQNWTIAESNINNLGTFGIGESQIRLDFMRFLAKYIMEGAFRLDLANNILMKTDLRDSNRVPSTPPAVYPYILDPNRAFIVNNNLPNEIVDWVVIEFRDKDFAPDPNKRHFKTALLRRNGSLVDVDGFSPVILSKATTQDLDTTGRTPYFIAVRHRNHLTVMSESAQTLSQVETKIVYDFSDPSFIFGGSNAAIKPMGRDIDGKLIFASLGGNYVNPNVTRNDILAGILGIDEINQDDYNQSWLDTDMEGYFDADYEMSGYINTRDFNISWNNRTRTTVIK